MLPIVCMRLRVLQNRRLFYSTAFWIDLGTLATDGLNRHGLFFFDELIDAALNERNCPVTFRLVVFEQPRLRMPWFLVHLAQ